MKLICEICSDVIAEVLVDKLKFPMTGDMFDSPDKWHGLDAPFPKDARWEDFRHFAHRPMIEPEYLLTDEGIISLPLDGSYFRREEETDEHVENRISQETSEEESSKEACEVCGKTFTKEVNLKRHRAAVHNRRG